MNAGVAISTTGDEHRLGFLETCVRAWAEHLPEGSPIFVTVDGDEAAVARAAERVFEFAVVLRVGQPGEDWNVGWTMRDGHIGVAANKNTGIEALMTTWAEHLFLCDDDTWPISVLALGNHVHHPLPHSMVCWGKGRLAGTYKTHASWTWPRGVVLYAERKVIEQVGGMDERFGPGGHEHVEWSKRIFNAGFTAEEFCSPVAYAADLGMGAMKFWHCSDILRNHPTSVRRVGRDWDRINEIMTEREGSAGFVPFRATENARQSATMWTLLSDDQGVNQQDSSAKEPGST